MDAFWIVPAVCIVVPLLWAFYLHIKRLPANTASPHVIVDKPSTEPPMDPAKVKEWTERPCASMLDWRVKKD